MGKRIVVVGGGASGMMAAIIAARNGAEVRILEQMNRVGKKILATGNGRCNLSNQNIEIKRYHGRNPKFALGILNQFDVEQTIQFFEYLGIACKTEEGGKIYPASDQASSVLDVMRYELEQLGIPELCEHGVKNIHPNKKGFDVTTRDGDVLKCDRVIIATGGKASPNLGSNGSGYNLVTPFGHKLVDTFPALVQLRLDESFLKAVKGVKFMGAASVGIDERVIREEWGELLFTDYGISGPPVFQLSRSAGEQLNDGRNPWIKVDMFPEVPEPELYEGLKIRIGYQPQKPSDFSFIGLINKRLIPAVLKAAGVEDIHRPCSELSEADIRNITGILKRWKMKITGTQSWTDAQVTAGGVDVKDINPKTLESKLIPGLYFCGEVVDIDGDCGGFNLQWAWSSGYIAGLHSASD